MHSNSSPDPVLSEELAELGGGSIRHGFFTRTGGVSEGIYRGLNVGVGSLDDPKLIAENRRRVTSWMGCDPESLATVHQIHSPDVIAVEEPFHADRPMADGLVTNVPHLAIGVLTADCGPVLFADRSARVVGAAHAGWKGALTGVLESTVEAMERLGAKRDDILAVLGPSISQKNYEVGPEFVSRFAGESESHLGYFIPSGKEGHFLFDLQAFTVDRLERSGIRALMTGECTYGDEKRFFSYRRTTHRCEPDYGRQISVIMLEDM